MNRRFSSQFLGMNSTVIYRNDAALVVDPGVFPKEVERIKKFLGKMKFAHVAILLTHTHGDHISGWNYLRNFPTFGHESIAEKSPTVRENDVRYLKGMYRKQSIEEFDQLIFPDNIQFLPTAKPVEIPPCNFLFYHVPGHSADSSAIVVTGEKLMLSGDMLIQTPAPFILHSTRQYWTSLKYLKNLVYEYELQCLIPGHGRPAKSEEEILQRIEQEQTYLQKLVWEGVKLFRTGLEESEIMSRLLQLWQFSAHAHRVNVNTLLRELQDWTNDSELDLNFD